MTNQYLLNEAAKIVGVRGYQIAYALTQQYLEEPELRMGNQRLFTDADIERIRIYFKNKTNKGRPPKGAS